MKQQKCRKPSTWHGEVYHAAPRCQAASLSLTARRLHGLKKTCQVEGQKTGCCFASQGSTRTAWGSGQQLCSMFCVETLCCFKGAGLIGLLLVPDGKNDPDPQVGKRTHCLGVTFPFLAKAMVVVLGPGFRLRTLPSKLVQRIAQRLDTGIASVWLGILAAFIGHRGGAGQCLQTGCVLVARAIIPNFWKPARGQPLSSTRQGAKDLVVFMRQKKALDLLVIAGNLLKQGQQLSEQHQQQARLGASGDGVSGQMGLLERLEDLGGYLFGGGMTRLGEQLGELLLRGAHRLLGSRIGLQEEQGRALLQFREERQRHGVVGLQAGRELIDQACLALDQGLLVTGQRFEFGDDGTIGLKFAQISQLRPAVFSEQIGINVIRLGSRGTAVSIDRLGIDRIHRVASFQQGGDEQAMAGFDNASQILLARWTSDGEEKVVQFGEPLRVMSDPARSHLTASVINDQHIMIG